MIGYLRGRPPTGPHSKAEVVAAVRAQVWPLLADGAVLAESSTGPVDLADGDSLRTVGDGRRVTAGPAGAEFLFWRMRTRLGG